MALNESKIKELYDNMYNAQASTINTNKQNALNSLNAQKSQTKNEYQNLYNNMNREKQTADTSYYNQKNETAVQNAQQQRAIRDWMARNNLLQSGESLSAQLRQNTDYNNAIGSIASNQSNYNTNWQNELTDTRQKEQYALDNIANTIATTEKSYADRLAELQAQIENQRAERLYSYLQEQRAMAIAASRDRERAFKKEDDPKVTNDDKVAIQNQFANMLEKNGGINTRKWLQENQTALLNTVGKSAYNDMMTTSSNYALRNGIKSAITESVTGRNSTGFNQSVAGYWDSRLKNKNAGRNNGISVFN